MRGKPQWFEVVIGVLMIATVVFVIWFSVHEYQRKEFCVDNGGHVEEYNCEWVPMSCGDDCTTVVERCDWRCVGDNPEAR